MHSYTSVAIHVVFATKERRRLLDRELRERVFPYMNGIVREHGGDAITIGGVEDHVHGLIELPSTITIARLVQEIKGSSSRWINETWPRRGFAWQRGYGAFAVCRSKRDAVIRYIEKQEAHHRRIGFDEEFVRMLRVHGITPDSRDFGG
ncbi:MAG: IS200/IS605 family transposase [Thermoanaerobaculia bacterium]|nr:IS200/IS605 family transposase [Thermoanaerobaculia bacterium]